MILKRDLVCEHIRRQIAKGILVPGQKLPQGVDLAKELRVGHVTLRAAYSQLEKEKLITSIHGRGTFVSANLESSIYRTIGIILPSLGTPLTREQSPGHYSLVSGIISAAGMNNFEIRTLHPGRTHFGSDSPCFYGIDAIMVAFPHRIDNSMLRGLLQLNMPVLLLGLLDPACRHQYHCINIDYGRIGGDSVSYLYGQGRRRIAFASCLTMQEDYPAYHVLNGYVSRMKELDLSPIPIHAGSEGYGPLLPGAESLMRLQAKALLQTDAIITVHDAEALVVQTIVREKGRRVPEDVAIIGCLDNVPEACGITTWRIPWMALGHAAVVKIEWILRSPGVLPETSLIPCEFVRRQSA